MRLTPIIAGVTATILALVAGLHVYWAAGGRAGGAAVPSRPGGGALFVPSVGSTLAVAAALSVATWIVAVSGGLAPRIGPRIAYSVGVWGLGLVLAARAIGDLRYVGFFKRVRGTPFARLDDLVYTPLVALLALATLWLAYRATRGAR